MTSLGIGIGLAVLAMLMARVRRLRLGRWTAVFMLAGIFCLAMASGEPMWRRPAAGRLAVMVDLSPSTRGAQFRDPKFLSGRLGELIGNTPYRFYVFASDNRETEPGDPLKEIAANQTHFSPVDADAIVLLSDARFELPASSPPLYVVADSGLERVNDAAVDQLEIRGKDLAATFINSSSARSATFGGAAQAGKTSVPPGKIAATQPILESSNTAWVQLDPADLWPENDFLSIRVSPPMSSQYWWVGVGSPGGRWRMIDPASLPADSAEYLVPAMIVLANVDAGQLSAVAQDRLTQYVRDLGGSLLVLGGDHAFGSGGYSGTELEQMSPLSSSPPDPQMRWILLADGSGSMAGTAGDKTRFAAVGEAIARVLPILPPRDIVQVGQFSDALRWWSNGQSAQETAKISFPPADASPHGPTNLEAALNSVAGGSQDNLPSELLLLSDCDARIDHPQELEQLLSQKKIRLDVLAIGRGSGLDVIRQISRATGGNVVEQLDPRQWIDSAIRLTRQAMPPRLMRERINARFLDQAQSLGSATAEIWNRTWLKSGATLWAQTDSRGQALPLAAFWHVGRGGVASAAFLPSTGQADRLASLIAQPPRDPRFAITWRTSPKLAVRIGAIQGQAFLNDLKFSLEISGQAKSSDVPQMAPGLYEIALPAPREPSIVSLNLEGRTIDRIAVAGRYAPEFDALGNDEQAMRRLADRSGGQVIGPNQHSAIDFHWPARNISLMPWLCATGVGCMLMGLLCWRAER